MYFHTTKIENYSTETMLNILSEDIWKSSSGYAMQGDNNSCLQKDEKDTT